MCAAVSMSGVPKLSLQNVRPSTDPEPPPDSRTQRQPSLPRQPSADSSSAASEGTYIEDRDSRDDFAVADSQPGLHAAIADDDGVRLENEMLRIRCDRMADAISELETQVASLSEQLDRTRQEKEQQTHTLVEIRSEFMSLCESVMKVDFLASVPMPRSWLQRLSSSSYSSLSSRKLSSPAASFSSSLLAPSRADDSEETLSARASAASTAHGIGRNGSGSYRRRPRPSNYPSIPATPSNSNYKFQPAPPPPAADLARKERPRSQSAARDALVEKEPEDDDGANGTRSSEPIPTEEQIPQIEMLVRELSKPSFFRLLTRVPATSIAAAIRRGIFEVSQQYMLSE